MNIDMKFRYMNSRIRMTKIRKLGIQKLITPVKKYPNLGKKF